MSRNVESVLPIRIERHFIETGNARLYLVLFLPEPVPKVVQLWTFIHPLFEEKKSSHRFFVETARKLCGDYGFAVAMPDLSGCGDSSGQMSGTRIGTWLEEIDAVRDFLASRLPENVAVRLNYAGVRFGASLAMVSAAARIAPRVERMVLIDPVLNGMDYFRDLLQQKRVREMMTFGKSETDIEAVQRRFETDSDAVVDLDGTEVDGTFYETVVQVNLSDLLKIPGNPGILLIQQSPKNTVAPASQALLDLPVLVGANRSVVCIQAPPFWKAIDLADSKKVIDAWIEWIKSPIDS
jgi:pimeloyl-ACP methyl ester carboxylesterase